MSPTHPSDSPAATGPVLVTGASGYLASWIIKLLVERGYTVHATVRDPSDRTKVAHLDAMTAKGPGAVRVFKADLLAPGSFAQAMAGCTLVFHTASPFKTNVKDVARELVEPALQGTRNVLEEANRSPAVRRVVLTSSCAAIYGDNVDVQSAPGHTLTEEVWNTTSTPAHNAYSYSKTVAERAAWEIANQQTRWDLVAVNPSILLGPAVRPDAPSESLDIMRQAGDGSNRMGVPRLGLGVVDVRDAAEAHLRAAFTASARGRHIIAGHATDLWEIVRILRERYDDRFPLPKRPLPKWLVWLVGPIVNPYFTRKMVARNLGYPFDFDNGKSVRELGMTYRPLEETIVDMFQQMADTGQFDRKTRAKAA